MRFPPAALCGAAGGLWGGVADPRGESAVDAGRGLCFLLRDADPLMITWLINLPSPYGAIPDPISCQLMSTTAT